MTHALANAQLARVSELIEKRLGLHFPPSRLSDLQRALGRAVRELGTGDGGLDDIERKLSGGLASNELDVLVAHLTVGETYFFRERCVFDALRSHILPELIGLHSTGNRRLRIWSAGCCTGEEAYSLAILLEDLIPDIEQWDVTVLASDLNPRFLQVATEGIYKEWSFRDTLPSLRSRHFRKLPDGRYELVGRARHCVRFVRLNLAENTFPSPTSGTSGLDLILCRNVLMYFSPRQIEDVISRLHSCLVEGGWLVVSPTEVSQHNFRHFRQENHAGAILYRKLPPDRPMRLEVADEEAAQKMPDQVLPLPQPRRSSPRRMRPAKTKALPAPVGGYDRAEAFHASGRGGEAEEAVLEFLRDHPNHASALALRSRIAADRGRLTEALEWCGRSIAADRLEAATHHLHASVLEELGRDADAEAALRTALYLDPDFVPAWLSLGNLALKRQDKAHARRCFDTVLALLKSRPADEELSGFDGLTAGRVAEIARSMIAATS